MYVHNSDELANDKAALSSYLLAHTHTCTHFYVSSSFDHSAKKKGTNSSCKTAVATTLANKLENQLNRRVSFFFHCNVVAVVVVFAAFPLFDR